MVIHLKGNSGYDYEDVRILDVHLMLTDDVMQEFIAYADTNGVAFDEVGYAVSKEYLELWIKAYIADNLWSNRGFYPILHTRDKDIQEAIKVLNSKQNSALAEIIE